MKFAYYFVVDRAVDGPLDFERFIGKVGKFEDYVHGNAGRTNKLRFADGETACFRDDEVTMLTTNKAYPY